MSASPAEPGGWLAALLRAVGGPLVLSIDLALWSFPLTVLTVVWVGWALSPGFGAAWFVVAVAAHLAMVLGGLLLRPWLLPLLEARPRPGLGLAILAALGLVRGLTAASAVVWFGLPATSIDFVFRPLGGIATMVSTGSLLVWAIAGRQRHLALMRELDGLGSALARSRDRVTELLAADRQEILRRVDEALARPLESLRDLLAASSADTAEVAARIDELLDLRVRPLSQELASEIRSWQPEVVAAEPSVVVRYGWPMKVERPVLPGVLAVTIAAMSPAVLSPLMPWLQALLASVIAGVGVWLVAWGVSAIQERVFGPLGWWGTAVTVALVAMASAVPIWVALVWAVADRNALIGFWVGGIVSVLAVSIVLAVASAVAQAQREAEAELRERNAELAVEVARVSSQLWAQQTRIAHVLHGPLQGALIVTIAKLEHAPAGHGPTAAELLAPIDAALAELRRDEGEHSDLGGFLTELEEVWSAVLRLDVHAGKRVTAVLRDDAALSTVLIAVIRELVNNAYRHGRSARASVDLRLRQNGTVELQVFSDGQPTTEDGRVGLGSRLLEATTIDWSRRTYAEGVQVLAVFPVSPEVASR